MQSAPQKSTEFHIQLPEKKVTAATLRTNEQICHETHVFVLFSSVLVKINEFTHVDFICNSKIISRILSIISLLSDTERKNYQLFYSFFIVFTQILLTSVLVCLYQRHTVINQFKESGIISL